MKLFVGVKPSGLKENGQLRTVYSKIKRTIGAWEDPVRWSAPDMWHVTVLFLGERTPEEFEKIKAALAAWKAPQTKPIELQFQGLGAFPAEEAGRVLWVGVRENRAFLALQASLEQTFLDAGLVAAPDREFKPHLTLARLRHTRNLRELISLGAKTKFGKETLSELVLFESVTENHMAKYIPRCSFPLA